MGWGVGPLTGGASSLEARHVLSEHSLFPWETQGSGFCQAALGRCLILARPLSLLPQGLTYLVSALGHGAVRVFWGHLHPTVHRVAPPREQVGPRYCRVSWSCCQTFGHESPALPAPP